MDKETEDRFNTLQETAETLGKQVRQRAKEHGIYLYYYLEGCIVEEHPDGTIRKVKEVI